MNVEGEDMYFDSVDSLSDGDSVSLSEENVGRKWDCEYEVWMNEPQSIWCRKGDFLRRMGLGENGDMNLERVTECSGAISLSGSVNEVDECLISAGRETADEALLHVDDLDSQDSTACSTEKQVATKDGLCKEASVNEREKDSIAVKPLSRWWSHLYKKPAGKGAVEASEKSKMNGMKVCRNKKKCMEFSSLYVGQEIKAHKGFILTIKFSPDGEYLASGGQDGVVRIWRVTSKDTSAKFSVPVCDNRPKTTISTSVVIPDKVFQIEEQPCQELHGHSGDILDLAWSKANCLLSSSNDKTVRLWAVGSDDCQNVYHHNDYVTCVQFNPVDDKHFISGSIDGKVRIWGVSNGRVVDWVNAKDVITALCYKPDGQGFVVGSISGICRFYGSDVSKEHIQLEAQIDVQGRRRTSHNKITGIEFSHKEDQRMMITSEDSKVSVFEGTSLTHKYKGLRNSGSQMSASFTSTGKHIISVGEDSRVYVWNYDYHPTSLNSKQIKSTHSCEHFFSEGVSVALPWLGRSSNEHRNEPLPSCKQLQPQADTKGPDVFSLGSWFSIDNQCYSGRAATWPEEQLPLHPTANNEHSRIQCGYSKQCSDSEVIVTGGLDGMIRTFHNIRLPSS